MESPALSIAWAFILALLTSSGCSNRNAESDNPKGEKGQVHKVQPTKPPNAFRALVEKSMEELRLKTSAHDAAWRLGEAAWNIDQNAGTIVFTRSDGIKATCPVQIVGTYNTKDRTWLWG